MIVAFRRGRNSLPPLHIGGAAVELVSCLSTWVCISGRTLSRATTLPSRLRRHSGSSIFSGGWGILDLGAHAWICSTDMWWWVSCGAASLCGSCSVAKKKASAEGGENCTDDCWQQLPHHRILHKQMQEKELLNLERSYSPSRHAVYAQPPQAGGCRASTAKPPNNSFFPEVARLLNSGGALESLLPRSKGSRHEKPLTICLCTTHLTLFWEKMSLFMSRCCAKPECKI